MNSLASLSKTKGSLLRWALLCMPLVLLLGWGSGQLSGSSGGDPWFAALEKPALYPPAATFGIAWSVLYLMMGLALAFVGAAQGLRGRAPAMIAFAVQFALNLAWSPIFFAAHRIEAALGLLLAIDVAAIVTTALFWRVRAIAGLLLLPYLGWLGFATYLNWQLLVLNPNA